MQSYLQIQRLQRHVQKRVDAVGRDHHKHTGVSGQDHDSNGIARSFLVESGAAEDRTDPRSWPRATRIKATIIIWAIVFVCGYASAANSSSIKRAAKAYRVSQFAEGFVTPMFLFGNAIGALAAGPLSETGGRNPVYLISMALYMICVLITALSPDLPVQLVFRFFAGLFASPPLTIYGGSLADMWDDDERSFVWPLFATAPLLGMIIFVSGN
jgi:MFS family permease